MIVVSTPADGSSGRNDDEVRNRERDQRDRGQIGRPGAPLKGLDERRSLKATQYPTALATSETGGERDRRHRAEAGEEQDDPAEEPGEHEPQARFDPGDRASRSGEPRLLNAITQVRSRAPSQTAEATKSIVGRERTGRVARPS